MRGLRKGHTQTHVAEKSVRSLGEALTWLLLSPNNESNFLFPSLKSIHFDWWFGDKILTLMEERLITVIVILLRAFYFN